MIIKKAQSLYSNSSLEFQFCHLGKVFPWVDYLVEP